MYKKLKEFCESKGLTVVGNTAYGIYQDYETNVIIKMQDNVSPVLIHFSFYVNDATRSTIAAALNDSRIKNLTFSFDPFGLIIGLNDLTVNRLIKRLDDELNKIIDIIRINDTKGKDYCPVCGEVIDSLACKECSIFGMKIRLDNKCVEQINQEIASDNQEFKEKPNNYLMGLLGAGIGALAGVISYIIIFFLGFISAISAFVSILLGTYLYKKFVGKPNKVMIVMTSGLTIFSLIFLLFILYILAATGLASQYGFDSIGFKAFSDMMTVKEFSDEFIKNLAMTTLFTIICTGYEVIKLFKSIKRVSHI